MTTSFLLPLIGDLLILLIICAIWYVAIHQIIDAYYSIRALIVCIREKRFDEWDAVPNRVWSFDRGRRLWAVMKEPRKQP